MITMSTLSQIKKHIFFAHHKTITNISNEFHLPLIEFFHDLSTTQEWQYCQLPFGHAIQNEKDQ